MIEKINSVSEEQEDLRIVEHLDMQQLPESLQQMISQASTPEEQDIILMATLAAASACVPNLYFRYGMTGKKYYANLQCFILAAAASVKGASEIKNPRLSMLLTGTFGQYRALVPSVENGYFSRLLTVVIPSTNGFDKRYVSSKGGQSIIPQQVGRSLLKTYETLLNGEEHEWSLTDAQKERLGNHLETEYATLIGLLGKNFHSAVVRMAVQIERMAMILTAMRRDSSLTSRAHDKEDSRLPDGTTDERIYCNDEDYETAEVIGNKMLLHMAAAYRMIDGGKQDVVPEIKPLDQRKVLFEQLKGTFERKELIKEAKAQGISERTAERWNDKWLEHGQVIKLEHGRYRKVG